jgi:hypothetical protein
MRGGMWAGIFCLVAVQCAQGDQVQDAPEERGFRGGSAYTFPPQTVSQRQYGPIPDYVPYPTANGNGGQGYNPFGLTQPYSPYYASTGNSYQPSGASFGAHSYPPSSHSGASQGANSQVGYPSGGNSPVGNSYSGNSFSGNSHMGNSYSGNSFGGNSYAGNFNGGNSPMGNSQGGNYGANTNGANSHGSGASSSSGLQYSNNAVQVSQSQHAGSSSQQHGYSPQSPAPAAGPSYPVSTFSPPPPTYPPAKPPQAVPESCLYCPASSSFRGYDKIHDVRDVSAADIDVIAGIGGSFLAGTALGDDTDLGDGWWADARERSFALGAKKSCLEVLTFANLLETLNPKLRGVAGDMRNDGYLFAYGPHEDKEDVEEEGDYLECDPKDPERSLESEADKLVDAIMMDSQIGPHQWKLVFVMPKEYYICRACIDPLEDGTTVDIEEEMEKFEIDFKKALDRLLSLEGVIVAVIDILDMDELAAATGELTGCAAMEFQCGCPCMGAMDFPDNIELYRELIESAVNSYHSTLLHREDAAIILLKPWKDAITMFSHLELQAGNCINWGEDVTATAAALLWNSVWRSYDTYSNPVDIENLDAANIISGKNSENLRLVCPQGPLLKNHH